MFGRVGSNLLTRVKVSCLRTKKLGRAIRPAQVYLFRSVEIKCGDMRIPITEDHFHLPGLARGYLALR